MPAEDEVDEAVARQLLPGFLADSSDMFDDGMDGDDVSLSSNPPPLERARSLLSEQLSSSTWRRNGHSDDESDSNRMSNGNGTSTQYNMAGFDTTSFASSFGSSEASFDVFAPRYGQPPLLGLEEGWSHKSSEIDAIQKARNNLWTSSSQQNSSAFGDFDRNPFVAAGASGYHTDSNALFNVWGPAERAAVSDGELALTNSRRRPDPFLDMLAATPGIAEPKPKGTPTSAVMSPEAAEFRMPHTTRQVPSTTASAGARKQSLSANSRRSASKPSLSQNDRAAALRNSSCSRTGVVTAKARATMFVSSKPRAPSSRASSHNEVSRNDTGLPVSGRSRSGRVSTRTLPSGASTSQIAMEQQLSPPHVARSRSDSDTVSSSTGIPGQPVRQNREALSQTKIGGQPVPGLKSPEVDKDASASKLVKPVLNVQANRGETAGQSSSVANERDSKSSVHDTHRQPSSTASEWRVAGSERRPRVSRHEATTVRTGPVELAPRLTQFNPPNQLFSARSSVDSEHDTTTEARDKQRSAFAVLANLSSESASSSSDDILDMEVASHLSEVSGLTEGDDSAQPYNNESEETSESSDEDMSDGESVLALSPKPLAIAAKSGGRVVPSRNTRIISPGETLVRSQRVAGIGSPHDRPSRQATRPPKVEEKHRGRQQNASQTSGASDLATWARSPNFVLHKLQEYSNLLLHHWRRIFGAAVVCAVMLAVWLTADKSGSVVIMFVSAWLLLFCGLVRLAFRVKPKTKTVRVSRIAEVAKWKAGKRNKF